MKVTKSIILMSPSTTRPYSKNGLLLLSLSFVFATTFIIICNDAKSHQSVVVSDATRGRQTTPGNISCVLPKTVIEHGCYRVSQDTPPTFSLMRISELMRRNCSRRVPKAVIIGTKKSGTTTLKNFLSYHPDVAFAERELKFVNSNPLSNLDDYRALMPFSTPSQVPMEKTPGYFIRTVTAGRFLRAMPRTKFIVILRDPVKRAVSDYVHMRYVDNKREEGAKLIRRGREKQMVPRYELLGSFEESVLFPNGSIREYNSLVDSGLYVKYFSHWLSLFPPEQFLILDGEPFVRNPAATMGAVEDFLGIGRYFTEDHFYYDELKRFYCLKKPLNTCMSNNKGRPHPVVSDDAIIKLQEYYHPHNRALEQLLNMNFTWS